MELFRHSGALWSPWSLRVFILWKRVSFCVLEWEDGELWLTVHYSSVLKISSHISISLKQRLIFDFGFSQLCIFIQIWIKKCHSLLSQLTQSSNRHCWDFPMSHDSQTWIKRAVNHTTESALRSDRNRFSQRFTDAFLQEISVNFSSVLPSFLQATGSGSPSERDTGVSSYRKQEVPSHAWGRVTYPQPSLFHFHLNSSSWTERKHC